MTAIDFTMELFCRVDDLQLDVKKHVLAELYPSEVVTLEMLHALRGGGNRAFGIRAAGTEKSGYAVTCSPF